MLRKNFKPNSFAMVTGSDKYPDINGRVTFRQQKNGVLVTAEIFGLPAGSDTDCDYKVFAFHVHDGGECTGNAQDPFANTKGHFNPGNCPHPNHAGDLPPLFGNNGYAYMSVLTDRFTATEVIGKTVIIHSGPDDFHTQPSGNAGEKMACGVIEAL